MVGIRIAEPELDTREVKLLRVLTDRGAEYCGNPWRSRTWIIPAPSPRAAHQGRWCFGKTPMPTFVDATPVAKEKMIAA